MLTVCRCLWSWQKRFFWFPLGPLEEASSQTSSSLRPPCPGSFLSWCWRLYLGAERDMSYRVELKTGQDPNIVTKKNCILRGLMLLDYAFEDTNSKICRTHLYTLGDFYLIVGVIPFWACPGRSCRGAERNPITDLALIIFQCCRQYQNHKQLLYVHVPNRNWCLPSSFSNNSFPPSSKSLFFGFFFFVGRTKSRSSSCAFVCSPSIFNSWIFRIEQRVELEKHVKMLQNMVLVGEKENSPLILLLNHRTLF